MSASVCAYAPVVTSLPPCCLLCLMLVLVVVVLSVVWLVSHALYLLLFKILRDCEPYQLASVATYLVSH